MNTLISSAIAPIVGCAPVVRPVEGHPIGNGRLYNPWPGRRVQASDSSGGVGSDLAADPERPNVLFLPTRPSRQYRLLPIGSRMNP